MNKIPLPHLYPLHQQFPAMLLDAYGVFYGGQAAGPYPGAQEKLAELMEAGVKVGILSNTTQLSSVSIEKLEKQGLLKGRHFHFFITSGEICRRALFDAKLPFPTPNKKYLLFGKPHPRFPYHEALFRGTPYSETMDPKEADFLYISVPHIEGEDQEDPSLFLEEVQRASLLGLPFLCANPDLFAHEGNPPRPVVRQGSIAKLAKQAGASVYSVGKPYPEVYLEALKEFNNLGIENPQDILMVGDTPETDIQGGRAAMMKTALILTTGIFSERVLKSGLQECLQGLAEETTPDFLIEEL